MLDAFTSAMCTEPWGRIGYARALIEVAADIELKKCWKNVKQVSDVLNESDSEEVEELIMETPSGTLGASTPNDEDWTSNGNWCSKGTHIILGWNSDMVNVSVISQDDQAMHVCMWIKAEKKELFCTFIYAHNRYIQRHALWNGLSTHKQYVRNRPWCMLGDFNSALNLEDKSIGPSNIDISMWEFKECVEVMEVADVQCSGLNFTWNQKPRGDEGLLKKIDRVMENLEFNDAFIGAHAIFQPYRISDHSLAVLRIPTCYKAKPLPFKFANIITHNERFKDIVKDKWAMQFSGVELDKVQVDLDADPFNTSLREDEAAYVQAFNDALIMEEIFLKQKSENRMVTGDQVANVFVLHYETFLGQEGNTSNLDTHNLFSTKLDPEVALDMVRHITPKEVKDAIFLMGNDKAPGPDGFAAAFFKEAWDIIAEDVTKAIQEFFVNGCLLKELNHMIIALIPKVKSPSRINDYRLISCCNVIFKCITKIIANRIKESLKILVSPNQLAFVPGRRISDNILLTQEIMHNYHLDRGSPRCAFKVDIQKAYAMVDWEFLKEILHGFGFHNRMISWIMECVSSTSFSLSINGILHGYFKGKRGLRQGDPLFPYLFTLIMEVSTLILQRRVRDSDFTNHRYCSKLELVNLCFADDLFLFAHGDVHSSTVIMEALNEFKLASGLVLSIPKSTAYFCNVLNHVKLGILNILPFEEDRLPIKYLGSMQRGRAKVAWDVVCLPKKEGGLGVRKLEMFNKVLMSSHEVLFRSNMTWGWRKMLQLRPILREFIWYRIGNGAKVSMWSDRWCISSPLSHIISYRDISRAGYDLATKVKDTITNANWNWPHEWLVKYPPLNNINVPNIVQDVVDTLEWRGHDGSVKHFLVATVLDREDKLRAWDVHRNSPIIICPLCELQSDSHEHLFFECVFSRQVWDSVKALAGLAQVAPSIDVIIDVLIPIAKRRSTRSIIAKLVIAALTYVIWQERNRWLFKGKKRTINQVVENIHSVVKLKLLSCSFKKSKDDLAFVESLYPKKVKDEHQKPYGKVQPLEILVCKWEKITMDFMTKLPRTTKKHDVIWFIVDHLTKCVHFIPIRESAPDHKLAKIYVNEIVARHGVPISIEEVGSKELASTNVVLETTEKIKTIRERLKATQDRWKSYADKRWKPVEFNVGDFVMLKVSPWKGMFRFKNKGKLSLRLIGPFKILKRFGEVAYVLELPEEMRGIHNTFHVSYLKKCLADKSSVITLDDIEINPELTSREELETILGRKSRQLRNKVILLVKVQWKHRKGTTIKWEPKEKMRIKIEVITIEEYLAIEDKKIAKQSMNSSFEKLWYLADEDDEEETYVFDMNKFSAIQIHNNLSSKYAGTHESLYSTLNEKYDAIACEFSPKLEFLLASKAHTVVPVYSLDTFEEEYKLEYEISGDDEEVLIDDEFSDLEEENMREGNEIDEIFKIETNIFLFETPLCKEFKEFNHLLQIDVDVLTRDLPGFKTYERLEDGNFKEEALKEKAILEGLWGHENKKGKNFCSWLKESFGNYHELDYELMLKLEEYWWGKKEKEESSEDAWSNCLPNDKWDNYEHKTYIKTDVNSNYNTYNNVCQMFKNYAGINNDNDAIQANQEWFDDHEPMKDNDDDIKDLDDYLIPKDAPYYVDEEEEGFK
ncbi:hypothetical protein Tco_0359297 [Tanacetum coccineum]